MNKSFDFIVVGLGLAGIAITERLINDNKRVLVIDNNFNESSRSAGGIINAVILKRFTLVDNAQYQIDLLNKFYNKIESKLGVQFLFPIETLRRISSIEEQNNFIAASDRPLFSKFLSSSIVTEKFLNVISDFGFGRMLQTGYLDTNLFIDSYTKYLLGIDSLLIDQFDFSSFSIHSDKILYKGYSATKIIFAEGFGLTCNPYFSYLPLDGAKGELLLIKADNLDVDVLLKSDIFVLPVGDSLYKVGATYNWNDKTNVPTVEAKNQLLISLKSLLKCDFEVVNHYAGIRPTVKDRNALIGQHPEFSNLYVLNGLGTRGVMLAPYLSEILLDNINNGVEIPEKINITRFNYNK